MVTGVVFNRDVVFGRCRQCAALMYATWAYLRGDPGLGSRSHREYAYGAAQASYGRSRAQIRLRVRELERGI